MKRTVWKFVTESHSRCYGVVRFIYLFNDWAAIKIYNVTSHLDNEACESALTAALFLETLCNMLQSPVVNVADTYTLWAIKTWHCTFVHIFTNY